MNQIATQERSTMNAVAISSGPNGSSIAPQSLGDVVRFAEVMCRADIALPKHLRGNAGACMAVALQALEWQMSPFAVASKSYAVNGAIAYEAQLIAAVVNTRSGIKGRLKYEFLGEGDELSCKVSGILDETLCEYETPPIGRITVKNSPLWKSDPKQQLGYYAARSWARRHCPEVILGVYDRDEADHFGPTNAKDVTPTLQERLAAAKGDAQESEGFNRDFVAAETAALTGGQEIQNEEPSDPSSDVADAAPAVDQGSGDQATDAAPHPSAEDAETSETGAQSETKPADGLPAAPVSETDMVNSSRSNTAFLKAEMVKKLLALAGDASLTVEDRLQNLKVIHPDWVEQMPGHPTLVSAVFNTTRQVIRGEISPAKAREYMEGLL